MWIFNFWRNICKNAFFVGGAKINFRARWIASAKIKTKKSKNQTLTQSFATLLVCVLPLPGAPDRAFRRNPPPCPPSTGRGRRRCNRRGRRPTSPSPRCRAKGAGRAEEEGGKEGSVGRGSPEVGFVACWLEVRGIDWGRGK